MNNLKPCPACGGEVESFQEYTASFISCKNQQCLSLGLLKDHELFVDDLEIAHNNQWCFKQIQALEAENKILRECLASISAIDTTPQINQIWLNHWRNYTKEKARQALVKINLTDSQT